MMLKWPKSSCKKIQVLFKDPGYCLVLLLIYLCICHIAYAKELSSEAENFAIDATTEEIADELSILFDEYFKPRLLDTLPNSSTIQCTIQCVITFTNVTHLFNE